ncbi:PTS sugar transporter subunit IIC [Leuconostoc mesenteroides]|uniref:PTS sugar transporter subunit IIC n=5 Tax=Leuconostoc mesenteroides TaxID=1245 RepID=UPI001FA86C5F|nr:PTS transporter subunit EIIC [Leuconostoc mesenteroides]
MMNNILNSQFIKKVNEVTSNSWIQGIQKSITLILSFIIIGSLITVISLINNIKANLIPDLGYMSTFTFGMVGLFVAFLIPYNILQQKKNDKKMLASFTSLALYLMLIKPKFDGSGNHVTFELSRFGSAGLFLSIIAGIVVTAIILFTSRCSFFKKDTLMPEFIVNLFDSLIPITFIIFIGWLGLTAKNIDPFKIVTSLFSPLSIIGQSYIGFIVIGFVYSLFYSFGISTWTLSPIILPIMLSGIAENERLAAHGLKAVNITTQEVFYTGFIAAGGIGFTITLAIMMLFLSKSQQLKAVGRATFPASILNINEPLVYGAPIAFNPLLMIPMWLNGILIPAVAGAAMRLNIVPIPDKVFWIWYLPFPVSTYITTGIKGVLLFVILFILSWTIYYPFFKYYDAQLLTNELENRKN